jgi:hypothetical protein
MRLGPSVMKFLVAGAAFFAGSATLLPSALAQGSQITNACVNVHSGEIKVVAPGSNCPAGFELRQLGGGQCTCSSPTVQYVTGGMYPGTSVARAFCPAGTKVTGGGGLSLTGSGLQQSYPISDVSGTIAFGTTAIGWQVAAEDFSDVQAFVVCMGP